MPGTATYTPPEPPLAFPGSKIVVLRLRGEGPTLGFELMPNIVWIGAEFPEFEVPTARFRYDWQAGNPPDWPRRLEQVFSLGASGRYIVRPDDRLVVERLLSDGSGEVLFDGYAQIPQGDLGHGTEVATFE